jgi:hypothetical protein
VTFRASSDIVANEHIQIDLPTFGSPAIASSGNVTTELSGLTYTWAGSGPFSFNKVGRRRRGGVKIRQDGRVDTSIHVSWIFSDELPHTAAISVDTRCCVSIGC